MQFSLFDYIQVGATNKNCLKVLPTSDKSSFQKCLKFFKGYFFQFLFDFFYCKNHNFLTVVIGDETGMLNCLEFTRNEIGAKFVTTSFEKEITRIELTGSTMVARDKICASGGSMIRCFTSKGNEYFSYETNQSEAIKCLGVESNLLWTTGVSLFKYKL
jgi:hypothetical protein